MIETRLIAVEVFYERPLKARFFDVYKNDNYMTHYNFYQQYEDFFTTAKAKQTLYIFFIAFFFQDQISCFKQQYKQKLNSKGFVSLFKDKFKKNLENSMTYMDSFQRHIK